MLHQNGRKECVYGVRASANLLHDVLLTECLVRCAMHREFAVVRDPGEAPYPDAIMWMDQPYYWELDTGEESHAQLLRRFRAYADAGNEGWLLFCTQGERRLRNVAAIAPECALLSTVQRVIDEPMGLIWETADGSRYKLR